MHDGFPKSISVLTHSRRRIDGSTQIVTDLLEGFGVDKAYHNKIAVVINNKNRDGLITAIYSYDDRYFGVFTFEYI